LTSFIACSSIHWPLISSRQHYANIFPAGSTGKPKGLEHTTGGYSVYAAATHRYIFDYKDGDVYACVADVGWITGHTYIVYGPLLNGATTVIFESIPTYPDASRYWYESVTANDMYF
jgi:acetyl-CoA synthetase